MKQTKNNSCVFQTTKSYNFYIHTLFLLHVSTITYWVIYKGSYCPINQNHWIADSYTELTCWLESTRTWFQLNTATHCGTQVPCSAPTWQVGSIPQSPPHLAAGTSSWYRLKPRGHNKGEQQQKSTLGFSKAFFSLLRDWRDGCCAVLFLRANRPWRNWSIFKNNLFKAHQLAYSSMQENMKPKCEFTGYTGMSNSVQASGQLFVQQKDEPESIFISESTEWEHISCLSNVKTLIQINHCT